MSVCIVDSFCWGADNLLSTKKDTRVFAGEFTADVFSLPDCPLQPLLSKYVHIDVEFFNPAKKTIRDVVIQVSADVFELPLKRETIDQFTEHTDEVGVGLLLG